MWSCFLSLLYLDGHNKQRLMWVLESNCVIGTHTLKCEIYSMLVLFTKALLLLLLLLIVM